MHSECLEIRVPTIRPCLTSREVNPFSFLACRLLNRLLHLQPLLLLIIQLLLQFLDLLGQFQQFFCFIEIGDGHGKDWSYFWLVSKNRLNGILFFYHRPHINWAWWTFWKYNAHVFLDFVIASSTTSNLTKHSGKKAMTINLAEERMLSLFVDSSFQQSSSTKLTFVWQHFSVKFVSFKMAPRRFAP